MGLGIAVPRDLHTANSRDTELRIFLGPRFFDAETGSEREIEIWWRSVWRWTLEREKRERLPDTLLSLNWARPSETWASVTPVVLHHYPKKRDGDTERILREAFVSALFPAPVSVRAQSVSCVAGGGHAAAIPLFTEGGKDLCRHQVHVVATFAQPVRGPMLVGRGRFRGYGLFRPITEGR
jgi:CRISPR-associated protein Csb2